MSNKKEYAIGEEVQMGLVTLVCIQQHPNRICEECFGKNVPADLCNEILGFCRACDRTDKKEIIFKLK